MSAVAELFPALPSVAAEPIEKAEAEAKLAQLEAYIYNAEETP